MKTPGYAGEFKESLLAVMRKRKGILGFKFKMRSANCITNNQRNPHGKYKNCSTYKLELQVSYSLCTQIQAKRLLWRKRREIGVILRKLCEWKKITIVEAEVCLDHVHMLIEIPPKFSVSSVVGYIKGKSSILMYEKFPALQRKYKKRDFWCRGYYVDTVGKNTAKIKAYISNQLKEDRESEQLSMLGKL